MEDLAQFYSGKRVLVTGSHGFKGSWLVVALKHFGAEVFGFGVPNASSAQLNSAVQTAFPEVRQKEGDIRNQELFLATLEDCKPELIFHLAAEPLVSNGYAFPKTVFDINVMGLVNVLECCRHAAELRSIVNVTTDKVYVNSETELAFCETERLGGDDPYSASKACAEIVTHSYYESFFRHEGKGVATARAGNVIGAGDYSQNRLVPDMVRAIEMDQKFMVRNPEAIRPWQHVFDPLIGYLMLGMRLYDQPSVYSSAYNFGPDNKQVLPVSSILEIVQQEGIAKFEVEQVTNHLSEKKILMLDSHKAKSLLGWENSANLAGDLKNIFAGYGMIAGGLDIVSFGIKELNDKLRGK